MGPSPAASVESLTLRADFLTSRLSSTLGALARRRRELWNVKLQLMSHEGVIVAIAAVFAAGLVAAGIYRAATGAKRRRRERVAMLRRVWRHPERVGAREGSPLGDLGRALLVVAARTLATRVLSPPAIDGRS